MSDLPLLSLLIWLPILAGAGVLIAGDQFARPFALASSVIVLLLSLLLWSGYDVSAGTLQFRESIEWINAFGIKVDYALGVDGISIPLIILNTFITVIVVGSAWKVIQDQVALYMAAFLMMAGVVNGVFMALDAILFYIFFEAMLIPMFLVIGIWGGPRRVYASIKFFLYTFLGSVFLLISLIYLYQQVGSFSIEALYQAGSKVPLGAQSLIFLSFLLAFGVKIPMWPVHTWLPDAHVEAPTGGSVVLAAITLKVGGYAFLRYALPVAPLGAASLDWLVIGLSLIAIVYIGFVALVQPDMKKLIAYSSIAHMGFVTLGFFLVFRLSGSTFQPDFSSGAVMALQGGMLQMISHGFISAALFLCIGVLYDRVHSREISSYGGVANRMPVFAAFFVLFAMANSGLPGTSGFVGEFMVILASAKYQLWIAALAAVTLLTGAAYMLWLVKRVIYGEVANHDVDQLEDISRREFSLLGVLAIAVLVMGIWPKPLTDFMEPSIQSLLQVILPAVQLSAVGGV